MSVQDSAAWLLPAPLPLVLADAAVAYAAAGVAVFPCLAGGKRPLTEHGFLDASTDLSRIRAWWDRTPNANIGIPTGITVDVLDADVHAAGTGFPVLRALQQEGLVAGWGQAVRSPSGGLHLYYPASDSTNSRSWSRGGAHIDFRGSGGYIIAPPSRITTARGETPYLVIGYGRAPRPVAADTIRDLLTPRPAPRPVHDAGAPVASPLEGLDRLAAWVAVLPEGNRNGGLFWAACRAVEAGHTEADTFRALEPAARTSGLNEREIAATILSAHRTTQLTPEPSDTVSQGHLGRPRLVR